MTNEYLRVLRALDRLEWGYAATFSNLARRTKLKKQRVRVICRALARKGLAEHMTGLMYDGGPKDGKLAGSGYAITPAGRLELTGGGLT